MEPLPLGDRLKQYEALYETNLDKDQWLIIRIDGHKFSKFTRGFIKPFDDVLTYAMQETAKELLVEFKAICSYTQSDEITLVVKPEPTGHQLAGRVQKFTSLTAGFATLAFNKHLMSKFLETNRKDFLSTKLNLAYFDARIFAVPTREEAFNSILWRVRDAEKNSISNAAYAMLPHKSLMNINGADRIVKMLEKGYDWNALDDSLKYGIFFKKEKYEKEVDGFDNVTCTRSRVISFAKKLTFSEENMDLIL